MWVRLYVFGFLESFYLDQFLWFVYLLHLGYSATQVGLVYGVMQVGRFAFDVPSSLVADRFGHRPVLALGALAKAVSSILLVFAGHGLGVAAAASLFASLALTLPSGVDIAYLQQAVRTHQDQPLNVRFAHFSSARRIASLLAGLLGGVLANHSYTLMYAIDAAFGVAAAATAMAFPPFPRTAVPSGMRHAWLADVTRTLLAARPRFWLLGGLAVLMWSLSGTGVEYTQTLFQAQGASPLLISLLFVPANLAALAGSLLAGLQIRSHRWRSAFLWTFPVSAALRAIEVGSHVATLAVSAFGFALGRLGSGWVAVELDALLVELAPEGLQATAMSVLNGAQMLVMTAIFPLHGVWAAHHGIASLFAVLAVGMGAAVLGVAAMWRRAA